MRIHITSAINRLTVVALLVALIGNAVQVTPVYAAGIVVNTNADNEANDGKCTLREAINAANLNRIPSGSVAGECVAGSPDPTVDIITFADNYTVTVGSPLPYVTGPITIMGNGATNTIIQAGDPDPSQPVTWRVFRVARTLTLTGDLTLDGVTIRNGVCNGADPTPEKKCSILGFLDLGQGINGGGIYNIGTLTIKNSSLSGNSATGDGGAIFNYGTLTIENSTFSGNVAQRGGAISNYGTLTIENSTFSGNTAQEGGSIHNTGTLTVRSSTISGNTANDRSGGGIFKNSGTVHLKNTLIANNLGGNCVGRIINDGNNLDSGATCGWGISSGSLSNTDPLLDPLAYNRGLTQTMALQAGSPAIDAGGDCPATDQQGVTRAGCDIGAFEYEPPGSPIVVNSDADMINPNDGLCTLREAIDAANSDTASSTQTGECVAGSAGADIITFEDNYTITLAGSQLPLVTSPIMIIGKGETDTIIQAAEAPNSATWRVFQVDTLGNLTLDRLTVQHGVCNGSCSIVGESLESQSDGGGVYNGGTLNVKNSVFSGNSANTGGGVYNAASTMNIASGTFSGNSANTGGGVYNAASTMNISSSTFSGNSAATAGAGLYNSASIVDISSSTFSENSAATTGGGLYNFGRTLTVTNSTFSGNHADTGGGISLFGSGGRCLFFRCSFRFFAFPATMYVTNSTFSGNSASSGGGVYMRQTGLVDRQVVTATLKNTIVASNSGTDCGGNFGPTNGGNNLASDSTCGWGSNDGSIEDPSPMLGALADNGSRTQTMALLEGSPAINAGNDAVCGDFPVNGVDQRGVPRPVPVEDHCDIGAYEAPAPPSGADAAGVFRPVNGMIFLKNTNDTGFADVELNYGIPGDYPVTGDWDGNDTDTIGVYRGNTFLLRNSNDPGFADLNFVFGEVGDQPVVGDWNGDGTDTIGVYRPSTGQFLLRNSNSAGPADIAFYLGNVGDVGIAGDWNGDGIDTTGVFRPSNGVIFLRNTNSTGFADIALNYGIPGDRPVTGDWDNDSLDTIGVYRNGQFLLRNSNTVGFADIVFGLGNPGDMPIAGNWDGHP